MSATHLAICSCRFAGSELAASSAFSSAVLIAEFYQAALRGVNRDVPVRPDPMAIEHPGLGKQKSAGTNRRNASAHLEDALSISESVEI